MTSQKKSPKKYHLTEAETSNIKFRRAVLDFISQAVHEEMGRYLDQTVLPRLDLKDKKIEISEDGEWISEIEEKPKIIV